MTDKHLAVSLEHQVSQSREIKRLTKENNRLRSLVTEFDRQSAEIRMHIKEKQALNTLIAKLQDNCHKLNNMYGNCPACGCTIYAENLNECLNDSD
jgi:prefoldin subunit 5